MYKATTDQISAISYANLKNILANIQRISARFAPNDTQIQKYIVVLGQEISHNLIPFEKEVSLAFSATVKRVLSGSHVFMDTEHDAVVHEIWRNPVLKDRLESFFLEDFPGVLTMNLMQANYNVPR